MIFSKFLLSIVYLFMVSEIEPKKTDSEIVRSEDFSVRRFQEVIDAAIRNRPKEPQEELISLRAQLVIAERRWNDLREKRSDGTTESEKRESNRPQMLRAAQAEVDHYRVKINRIEEEILKQKRRERSKKKK